MAAYIHGNLAVEERQRPSERVKIKETRKVVYRTSQLSAKDKLLYLFTILVCVVVAGTIIWRYAQIYQMNTRIHNVEKQISRLEAENSALKEKVSKMIDPELLMKEATDKGLSQIRDKDFIRVPSSGNQKGDSMAMKP